jgi:predicted TIM-barrel fold metal-dependent hydrolase
MRTTIPELRIKDQDIDGVSGEVIYGILGAASRVADAEVAAEMGRIYNDFAADFARSTPDRFAMIGCLPLGDAEQAAAELRRCAVLGLKGVEIPVTDDVALWRDEWEPLWVAAAEAELPLQLHTIGGRTGPNIPRDRIQYLKWLATYMTDFQMTMARHIAGVLYSGALERHPALRVVIAEAGLGWLPYVLERMDYEWEDQFQNLELKMKPSEYWRRQMFVTFQQDQVGLELIDKIGADTVMWGSDFPHPDGIWPDSREFIREQFSALSEADRRKIVYENAAKLYGFPISE